MFASWIETPWSLSKFIVMLIDSEKNAMVSIISA